LQQTTQTGDQHAKKVVQCQKRCHSHILLAISRKNKTSARKKQTTTRGKFLLLD